MLVFRHIVGEALSSMTFKELKNLEGRLEKGITRVRTKKVLHFTVRIMNISTDTAFTVCFD